MADSARIAGLGSADRRTEILRARETGRYDLLPQGVVVRGTFRNEGSGLINTAAGVAEALTNAFTFTFKANRQYRIVGHFRAAAFAAFPATMVTTIMLDGTGYGDQHVSGSMNFSGIYQDKLLKYSVDTTHSVRWDISTSSAATLYVEPDSGASGSAAFYIEDLGYDYSARPFTLPTGTNPITQCGIHVTRVSNDSAILTGNALDITFTNAVESSWPGLSAGAISQSTFTVPSGCGGMYAVSAEVFYGTTYANTLVSVTNGTLAVAQSPYTLTTDRQLVSGVGRLAVGESMRLRILNLSGSTVTPTGFAGDINTPVVTMLRMFRIAP
jgi:hypothetical protein